MMDYMFLASMSDDELHSFAVKNSKRFNDPTLYPFEEQEEWAWNLLLDGTLDHMCTADVFQAMDGCTVEIDGTCEHGCISPMILTRLIPA